MKMKRHGVNVKETALKPREKHTITNLEGGIPLLVKSSKSPKITVYA